MENPQSLMHLQSSRGEGGGFQIKKPCCSPAAYRPLDILHLDQVAYHIRHIHWESYFQQKITIKVPSDSLQTLQ